MNPQTFKALIESRLSELSESGRRKKLPDNSLLHLSANDYLGLSRHPSVIDAICSTTEREGTGSTGSRLLSGNHPLNDELEEAIADFKGGPCALVFSTGYQANVACISSLATLYPNIYSDSHVHASLIDGIRMSGVSCQVFPHNNIEALKEMLERRPLGESFVIVTESLFSMDGDRGPIAALLNLCDDYDGILLIDDAHATGTLGQGGRGGLEEAGLAFNPQRMVLTGTFSKALGGLGGYVVCHPLIRELVISLGRSFVYTTALPPGILAGNIAALAILDEDETLVQSLRKTVRKVRESIGISPSSSPILPIRGPLSKLKLISGELLEKGWLAPVIHPPTVPEGEERIRISVNLPWNEELTAMIAEALKKHHPLI